MKIAVQKPEFLPGIDYFDRINCADTHVLLDTIRLNKRDVVSRARILAYDSPEWILVPLERSGRSGQKVRDTKIDNSQNWSKNLLRQLHHFYKSAPFFDDIFPVVSEIIRQPHKNIAGLDAALIDRICSMLQISGVSVQASSLKISGTGDDHLIQIVRAVGGDTLLLPRYAKKFIDKELFAEKGIKVEFRSIKISPYNQYRAKFHPDLSIFDVMCYCSRIQIHSFISG